MPVFVAINEFGNQGEQLPESLAHEANERYTDTLTSAIDISVGYLWSVLVDWKFSEKN